MILIAGCAEFIGSRRSDFIRRGPDRGTSSARFAPKSAGSQGKVLETALGKTVNVSGRCERLVVSAPASLIKSALSYSSVVCCRLSCMLKLRETRLTLSHHRRCGKEAETISGRFSHEH